jgi:2-succinyl-5-enolpyruvyl-6-hydroxy-3-cyclohexene-1-carboxylate synthase
MEVTAAATFCAALVDEWVSLGMTDAVVAPGSRSTPLALAFAARPDVTVHVVHDERSAAFIALGRGLATGTPTPVLCTSGTAATHFHAAVVEAHLSEVPLLVCTADRPPELRDVGAPQTIDQLALYGRTVRAFIDAGVPDHAVASTWRGLAARAWSACLDATPGPVQLNLPFREPLVGAPGPLPPRRAGSTPSMVELVAGRVDQRTAALLAAENGLIVAGHGSGTAVLVRELGEVLGWPIVADSRSNVRGPGIVSRADTLLRSADFASSMRPDVVLRLGRPPASKVLNSWLATLDASTVHVAATPTWIDPDGVIGTRLVGDVDLTLASLIAAAPTTRTASDTAGSEQTWWLSTWLASDEHVDAALAVALSTTNELTDPVVARIVSEHALGHLVVSSSMPVRDLEWYGAARSDLRVHANRGANGIDGVIATAIGVATTGEATTVLLGDVAFLHDASSLTAVADRPIDLTIVVTDNDGGAIFEFLPQATAVDRATFELLYGTPHGTDLPALARAHRVKTFEPTSPAALGNALDDAARRGGVNVVVVKTDRAATVAHHEALHRAALAELPRTMP